MPDHDHFMQRALELARQAEGHTSPNPMVGAVVVRDGQIVGEGYHQRAGQPHAEVNALRAAGDRARGAALYVTLEPCNHHGRTPPCTDAILDAGIRHVVYALPDPNPTASGGAERLQQAGLTVTSHVCHEQAADLNRFFLHHVRTGRPYVVAKYAMSLDGRIATRTGHSRWITGEAARQRTHALRHAVDAIMVGAGTVRADDPQLTVRTDQPDPRHPLRVILEGRERLPIASRVFSPELPGQTLLATTHMLPTDHARQLAERGVDVLTLPGDADGRVHLPSLLDALGQRSLQSLMVEGGGALLGALFDAGLVDEVWAFVAPVIIGGSAAPGPVAGLGVDVMDAALRLQDVHTEQLGSDLLIRARTQPAVK